MSFYINHLPAVCYASRTFFYCETVWNLSWTYWLYDWVVSLKFSRHFCFHWRQCEDPWVSVPIVPKIKHQWQNIKLVKKTALFLKKKKYWDFISVKWLYASNVREAQTKPVNLLRLCLISYSQRSVLQDEGHLCHTASWSCLDVLLSGEVRLPLKAAYTRR